MGGCVWAKGVGCVAGAAEWTGPSIMFAHNQYTGPSPSFAQLKTSAAADALCAAAPFKPPDCTDTPVAVYCNAEGALRC